jgi:Tol biopolymer transport system component
MNRTWTAALFLALAALPAGAVNVELLSRIPPRRAPETANGASRPLAISADGRYTVLASEAVNLAPGLAAEPVGTYLYLHDRTAGTATWIGRRAVSHNTLSSDSVAASISADGRFVAFQSRAMDEVEGQEDANETFDVFLWDRVTGESELVSRSDGDPARTADGGSTVPILSADGRFVVFLSTASDLVAGLRLADPGFPHSHLFLWDRETGEVLAITRSAKTPGRYAGFGSGRSSISADGRFVAFTSLASDLVAGQIDPRRDQDAFLWDRVTQRAVLVSRAATGVNTGGNRSTLDALVSADGRFVALLSLATDLRHGQQNGGANVFLWERASGSMFLVSHGSNLENPALRGRTELAAVSADGSSVLFTSNARNLVPGRDQEPGPTQVFLWSRASNRNRLVSRGGNADSVATGLSADGAWIVFESAANGRSDVFLANGRSGKITLLSEQSSFSRISADGRWIAFASTAPDLEAGVRDTNLFADAVLTDRQGDRTIISVHPPGLASATPQGESRVQSIDASGRFVVFLSTADAGQLLSGVRDANGFGADVFLYDRQLRTLALVTRSAADPGATANGDATKARISADGRWVAFASNAPDLVSGQSEPSPGADVFLWDRTTGQTVLASRSAASPTTSGDGPSLDPEISADGSAVAFTSAAADLVPGQTGLLGIFVFDRTSGTVSLASPAAGSETAVANSNAIFPKISADGRFVAFTSAATDHVAGVTDTNQNVDVFLFDRATGTTVLVSRTTAPSPTAALGIGLGLSGDGRFVLFESLGTDLVPGQVDPLNTPDLFLFDRIAGTATLVTHAAGAPLTAAAVNSSETSLSADGRFVAFSSMAHDLVPGQVDNRSSIDIFVYDRETGAIEMVTQAAGTVATAGSGGAARPVISADGRRVAFLSNRLDLSPGLHGPQDVYNLFVHDRPTGTNTLVSRSLGDPARLSAGDIFESFLNADGSVAAFTSTAPDLVPRDFNRNVGLYPDAFAAFIP